ncbi:hypothetical protein LOTGIDRAFT_159282 [Lottia gigantea]|uniref:C3H1-type domain-containing protein n=1 Tax=Lottia gigantea TaxID=225164 RepID=V4C6G8_LOTGI|nr:hypothetical protein LOTGIDRAFT_159282 [Lottia gigantea]ESO97259.1 hypothetical protein LOTGIDRAFT_159282 [Lottia gigantea]
MASLVADYSSEDEVYSDTDSVKACNEPSKDKVKGEGNKTNFLLTTTENNEDGTSSDDSDQNSNQSDSLEEDEDPPPERLPNPLLGDTQTGSVFINPFKQAELDKQTVLEKHVQMTEKKNIGNRKVCFKFRKGKCNRGKNCRFSHDIDTLRGANRYEDSDNHRNDTGHFLPHSTEQPFIPEPIDEDSFSANKKHKRKIGVSDTLVPPKKAMMSLNDQRNKERPWTLGKKKS